MQALTLTSFGGPDALGFADLTEPVVGPGQSAVNVRAVALGPWDLRATEGYFVGMGGSTVFPQVQGWDFAGETDDGRRALGFVAQPWMGIGSLAERIVVPYRCWPSYLTSWVGQKPRVARLCLRSRLLVEGARLSNGDVVVVTGAAGMVGGFAVQLARAEGARVMAGCTVATPKKLAGLGAMWWSARA